jgi:hypothetical protein
VRLFHTTSWNKLKRTLQSGKLKSLAPYISLSEKPLFGGDIRHGDVALVLDSSDLGNQIMQVKYTEQWAEQHPEHASYIAGEGWQEQFVYPDECMDEDGFDDEECMEQAWLNAMLDSFLWKKSEDEWTTKKEDAVLNVRGALLGLLVPSERGREPAQEIAGETLPVWVGVTPSATRVAARYRGAKSQ